MNSRPREITKATGHRERFSSRKLYRSLRWSGASKELAQRILDAVEKAEREPVSTRDIEQLAATLLEEESPRLASRYLLKKALFDLGPTGYPFERWVAALMQAQGYRTEVGVTLRGKCVTHEVDVVARKDSIRDLIECKFRSGAGLRCDVKVALYVYARSLDLRERPDAEPYRRFRLVTNTKFTGDAIQYARCVGLDLVGWSYPRDDGIPQLIEKYSLHPVTCLTRLSRDQRNRLVEFGTLLCRDLLDDPHELDRIDVPREVRTLVLEDIEALFGSV